MGAGVKVRATTVLRRFAGPVAVMMVTSLAVASAEAAQPTWKPPEPAQTKGIAVAPIKATQRPVWTAGKREVRGGSAVTWPAAGTASVALAPSAATAADRVKAGTLPVSVAQASDVARASVRLLDRAASAKAGVSGLVMEVGRTDGVAKAGEVAVTVDYRGFADAYGAGYGSRLRMVSLPDGSPLPSHNNTVAGTVTGRVPLAAGGATTMVGITAGASDDNGDFKATSLQPASTWQVSQQTGDFSWSYPFRVPQSVGGPAPSLALGYSSGSVDGRTAGTNTQGSWIGDGWDLWPGYVERSYRSCPDDKDAVGGQEPNNTNVGGGDLCWFNHNATMSLNGRSTELVRVSANLYRGVSDDGSKVERLLDTSLGNGDVDGEYWKVTTTDGTQYFFGRHRGVGGATAATTTESVWTAPVYSNHPDEPGYAAAFAGSRQTRAWRWNLDYVVDPHGNTMTFFYQPETGAYGREGDPDKRTEYIRGGWLSKVEYNSRRDASATTQPGARVLLDVADRCPADCYGNDGSPAAANWVDTPWDQFCRAGTRCLDQASVTFWTGKRLSRVRTQVYAGTGTQYQDVESWTLNHTYLESGNNEGKPMWLRSLVRTGKVIAPGVPEVSDPEVVFNPGEEGLANRVDGPSDGKSSLFRYRLQTITTESGAQISVAYAPPECVRTALPTEHANTKRCYPQYYAPEGEEDKLDWFHKYRVTRVDVYDNTGGFEHEQTNYDYLDTPAWHYSDSELIQEKKRTWSVFRGYGKVRVRKGLESGTQSAIEYLYFRGMHGDRQPAGQPARVVNVVDSQGVSVMDHEAYAGLVREEIVLEGAGGAWISGTINTPVTRNTATAGPLKAWMTNNGTVRTRTKLSTGATRWTKTITRAGRASRTRCR